MRIRDFCSLLLLSVVLVFGASACSNDSTGSSLTQPSASLAGTYSLSRFAFVVQGQQQTVPGATGTFTLTADNTYTLTLAVPGQPALQDSGSYAISGSNWSQSSPTTGQATGTFILSGNQLTVDATSQGVESVSVWQRQ
ncbi:MAG TPA: hypothetical protein VFS11_03925 [Gemmatimonadales bacterium]|nr:hypothetical protein [Gemmatimonadales bacterium]